MKKLLIITTALVAFGAEPAHAGPVVGWLAVNVFGGMAATTGLALARLTVGLAMSFVGSAIQKAMTPAQKISVKTEIEIGDDTPLSFVVGDYVTAGKRKYAGSWGRNTRFITEVIEVSCLPQGLAGLWVDDEAGEWAAGARAHAFVAAATAPGDVREVTFGSDAAPGAGQVYLGRCLTNYGEDDGDYPLLYVRYHDGTQTTADPFLIWAFGADPDYPWTYGHIGTGKSYVIVTARYDSDTLTSYPQFLWQLEPLPLYDPRKDSANGGSGSHRWGNRATYEPSCNPAVISYNLARGIYYGDEWVFGGRNLAAWRLPVAEWFAAMNAADAAVTLANGSTEPAYRAGAEITVDLEPAGVLEEIGKASNLRFAEVGGLLKPQIEVPSAAVLHITDDDIIITEGQSHQPFNAIGDTYNALSATYPARREKWASKDAREYIDADATAEDGQWVPDATGALVWVPRYLPTSISYGAAPYPRQVQRLMRAQMRDFRRMRIHEFQLPPMAYALEPLVDKITWTSARNGYTAKEFLVEKVQKLPGMCVPVALREVDAGDYDWSSDYELPTTDVVPVNPVSPLQPISGFTAVGVTILDSDGVARRPAIRCDCTGGDDASAIRIQMRRSGSTEVEVDLTRPYDAPYRWFILDVIGGVAYQVRSILDVRRAEWSGWVSATAPVVATESADVSEEVASAIQTAQDQAAAAVTAANAAIALAEDLAAGAASGYLIRVQSGGAVSLLDLVAADGSGGVPTSIARIAATDILLDGSVAVSQLTVTDLTGNLFGNGDFAAGDLRGWTASGYAGASVVAGSALSAPSAYALRFGANSGQGAIIISRQLQHCVTGERLSVGMQYQAPSGSYGQILLQALWYNASGAYISGSTLTANIAGSTGGWQKASGVLTVPASAVRMVLRLLRAAPSGSYTGAGYIYVAMAYARRQQDGAVLITPSSITGALVQARTLRGEHLEAGTITAESGVIGDLAVDTLQIADFAVTVPVSSYVGGQVTAAGTEVVVGKVTIDRAAGSPTMVWFAAFASMSNYITLLGTYSAIGDISYSLYRDGVLLLSGSAVSVWSTWNNFGFVFCDTNTAGGATVYEVRAKYGDMSDGTPSYIRRRSMLAMVVKK